MPKNIPMPPVNPMPNPISNPTPMGPANTGPIFTPQRDPMAGEGILNAFGASTRPDGSLKIKGRKEQSMGVVRMAQSMFSPNMMNMPPVKPITNPMLAMGTGPAMDTSGSWGSPPNKKAR